MLKKRTLLKRTKTREYIILSATDSINVYVSKEISIACKKRHCYELWLFLIDVRKYQKRYFFRKRLANHIYKKYITDQSSHQINIASDLKKDIFNSYKKGKVGLFDQSVAYVKKMIQTNMIQ